jgi:hypothetical protein
MLTLRDGGSKNSSIVKLSCASPEWYEQAVSSAGSVNPQCRRIHFIRSAERYSLGDHVKASTQTNTFLGISSYKSYTK